jgi:Mn-dependent DtxR family transcriptional regulator
LFVYTQLISYRIKIEGEKRRGELYLTAEPMKKEHDTNIKNIDRLESIRHAHNVKREERTNRMEDYLEVIFELIKQKSYATSIDISESLNVSSPSVTKMVRRLYEQGYLNYEKYRGISLTQQGTSVAISIHDRHSLLTEFLIVIGVNEDIANMDAEGIEHHVHPETLKKLEEFVKHIKKKNSKS